MIAHVILAHRWTLSLPAKIWIFVAHSQEARQFWAVKVFPAQSIYMYNLKAAESREMAELPVKSKCSPCG
jgi:hypothetical protein